MRVLRTRRSAKLLSREAILWMCLIVVAFVAWDLAQMTPGASPIFKPLPGSTMQLSPVHGAFLILAFLGTVFALFRRRG